jgi:hypothetical protein
LFFLLPPSSSRENCNAESTSRKALTTCLLPSWACYRGRTLAKPSSKSDTEEMGGRSVFLSKLLIIKPAQNLMICFIESLVFP